MSKIATLDIALQSAEKRAWESDAIPFGKTQFVLYLSAGVNSIVIDFTIDDNELDNFRQLVTSCRMKKRNDRDYPYMIFSNKNLPNNNNDILVENPQVKRAELIDTISEITNTELPFVSLQFGLLICVNNIKFQKITGKPQRK